MRHVGERLSSERPPPKDAAASVPVPSPNHHSRPIKSAFDHHPRTRNVSVSFKTNEIVATAEPAAESGEVSEVNTDEVEVELPPEGLGAKVSDKEDEELSRDSERSSTMLTYGLATVPEGKQLSILHEPVLNVGALSSDEILSESLDVAATHSESQHRDLNTLVEDLDKATDVHAALQIRNQIDDISMWPLQHRYHHIRSYQEIPLAPNSSPAEPAHSSDATHETFWQSLIRWLTCGMVRRSGPQHANVEPHQHRVPDLSTAINPT